jgi:SAM-dependent methyltransferase
VQRPEWAPEDVDMDSPSPARVYDALLGGSHNFEIDRRAAQHGTAMVPDLPVGAAANRRFLRRAVSSLVHGGIRQFVDLGAGIPTVGNTHEIVHELEPSANVVYVDIDAVAVAHATSILAGHEHAVAIRADVRSPELLLAEVQRTGLYDPAEPVGVLMVALLHLMPDSDGPEQAVATLRDAVAPGSELVISHLTSERRPEETHRLSAEVAQRDRVSLVFRPRAAIQAFFGDFTLLDPGLSDLSSWRPDEIEARIGSAGSSLFLAGVGHKD